MWISQMMRVFPSVFYLLLSTTFLLNSFHGILTEDGNLIRGIHSGHKQPMDAPQ